jgi:hypothetical protein
MNALSYRVILEPDEDDGGFNVVIPSFPTARTRKVRTSRKRYGTRAKSSNSNSVASPRKASRFCRAMPKNIRVERVIVAPPAA